MMKESRLRLCAAFASLMLCEGLSISSEAQERPATTFKNEVHLVNVTFSVRRADGTLVKGLAQDDFQVKEDGVPQKIAYFGREEDLPLTLGLIVDVSGSQNHFIKRQQKDIEKFLNAILRQNDQVYTICFGDHLRLTNDLTSNPAAVFDGLERFDHGGHDFPEFAKEDHREGGTALYDAVYQAVAQRQSQAEGRRRALILFTDGEENSSAHDQLDAIDAARENDTLIYAIRYTDQKDEKTPHGRQGIAALHHLASESGGSDFDALHADLNDVFAEIADELRSLYSIAYHSTNHQRDQSFRRVQITVSNSSESVHARAGYYAR